ncbi:MAG TPA: histidine kinase [Cytophagaceae bacterium]|jgi:sensor histidine kinase YesM|nr:histidine kinase [Cytophagaceae bacterium]
MLDTIKSWKKSETLLHIILWSILFLFPFLISGGEREPMKWNSIFGIALLPLILYAIVFYFNYYFLIDRYWFAKYFMAFTLVNLLLFVAGIIVIDYLRDEFIPDRQPHYRLASFSNKTIWNYSRVLISYVLTIGASVSIKMTKNWLDFEDKKKQLENEQLKSELSGLKYQLQPHFFFNTLNNIYALVDASPEQSKEALHQLSKMMRYLLYETDGETTLLSKEINFTISYIELMKMRVPKHVKISYRFPSDCREVEVLHLLFISLVENAFKHGISSQESFIDIQCGVSEDRVRFHVRNSNFPKQESDRSGSGIGMGNLRKRIELNDSLHYEFKTFVEGDTYHAIIEVKS